MENLEDLLIELANSRAIFHSEADFQHAFAWLIHEKYPNAKIRLEYPSVGINGRIYLDIIVVLDGKRIGIELKYKTKSLDVEVNNESYTLKNQGAQDIARYDLMSDIMRLESLIKSGHLDSGYSIFLTNDQGYWKDSKRRDRMDEEFRIHEGSSFGGKLKWANHTSAGTMKSREQALNLTGNYLCKWSPFSEIQSVPFRYLFFEVA